MGFWDWFRPNRRRKIEPLDTLDVSATSGRRHPVRPAASLPRFQERASDVARASANSPMRLKMRTAFTPSQPVSDVRMFAGRRTVLRNLIRAIEDQQLHVVLYGDRGIGKTSTLHVLGHLAREARYLVRYTSCSEGSDFSETFRAIAKDIPLIYHADTDPTSAQAETGGVLADLLPPGPLTVSQLADVFTRLTGVRVLIILDEFDRSDSLTFRRWVAELIKNLSDRSTRVQIVIAGVAANLTELIHYIPSIRRNIVGLPMSNMDRSEIEELVEIGSAASGLPYSNDALDGIAQLASGSPYLASLLGQHAGIAALDRGSAIVEQVDVEFAGDRALEEVEGRISSHTRHQIALVTDPEMRQMLTVMGSEALNHIGQIKESDAAGGDSIRRARAIELFSAPNGLLETTPDVPGATLRFREDGVALYLWLLGACTTPRSAAITGGDWRVHPDGVATIPTGIVQE